MYTFNFEHANHTFCCVVDSDDTTMGPPWVEHDGHGAVRTAKTRYGQIQKHPGEVVICTEGSTSWLYDFRGAVAKAKAGAWGCAGATDSMTKGQRAEMAAIADMAYCRNWLAGDRFWVCIEVYQLNENGEKTGVSQYLGGIDVGYSAQDDAYLRSAAHELADALAATVHA